MDTHHTYHRIVNDDTANPLTYWTEINGKVYSIKKVLDPGSGLYSHRGEVSWEVYFRSTLVSHETRLVDAKHRVAEYAAARAQRVAEMVRTADKVVLFNVEGDRS